MSMIRDGKGEVITPENPLAVTIAGANSGNGALGVDVQSSQIVQPVDVQARYAQTIQTHNAVSVATVSYSNGNWIDTNGFNEIAVSALNSAQTSFRIHLDWSIDGVTVHGSEIIYNSSTDKISISVTTKARYVRVALYNADATSKTMSAYAYLKC